MHSGMVVVARCILYVKMSLKYKLLPDLSTFVKGIFESLFIEIISPNASMRIGIIYCPKRVTDHAFDLLSNVFLLLSRL